MKRLFSSSSSSSSPSSSDTEEQNDCLEPASLPASAPKARQADFFVLALLTLLVLVFFNKTVLCGAPVSRVCRLAERDSLFSDMRSGVNGDYDCSIYQSLVPYYFLTARITASGNLPLWNPYAGCGAPLVGDILTTALAPLRLILSPFACLRLYNLTLVAQVWFGLVGAYFFARALALSRSAACFAAITSTFCPYLLFANELQGTSISLFPALFFLFVRMSESQTLSRCLAAGAGCAVLISSGHPELSLFGISAAALLFVLLTVLSQPGHSGRRLWLGARSLTIAALAAFCLSAPVLLPFIEYLANSACYKSALSSFASVVPWQRIAYNFAQPGFGGASSYLGIVAALLVPLALFGGGCRQRVLICLVITDALILAMVARLGPFDFLLKQKFLQWLVLDDAFPLFLLLTSMIAAFGFDTLRAGGQRASRCRFILFASALVVFCLPWLWRALRLTVEPAYVAAALQPMTLDFRAWTRDLVIFAVMLVSLFLCSFRSGAGKLGAKLPAAQLAGLVLIVLGFVSEASVARSSMPIEPPFEYKNVDPLPFLKGQGERIVTMGRHAFCPNSNFIYGISNLVTPNVQYPGRFLAFIKACGVTVEGVNQYFDGKLSGLVDLASVRYVLSPQPVLSVDSPVPDLPCGSRATSSAAVAAPGVRLCRSSLSFDQDNWQAVGRLEWSVDRLKLKRFSYAVVVADSEGHTLWFGDRLPLGAIVSSDAAGKAICQSELLAAVPSNLPSLSVVKVGVQVFDAESPFAVPGPLVPVGEFCLKPPAAAGLSRSGTDSRNKAQAARDLRFRFVSETAVNHLRVYENVRAMPQAYLVHKAIAAASAEDALAAIKAPDFQPASAVVLEHFHEALPPLPADDFAGADKVSLERPNPNQALLKVKSQTAGFLVLTDVFYPGWQAYLDEKPAPIYIANYLFRSVTVPAGEHNVRFSYEPLSFFAGMCLFGACAAVIVVVAVRRSICRRNKSVIDDSLVG